MSTKGEFYPLTSKSDPSPEPDRSASPVWISKLLGSVWKMDTLDNGFQPEGQPPRLQRTWEESGFVSGADDEFGRTVEKMAAQNWRASSTAQGDVAQYASRNSHNGLVNHNRGRFPTAAPSISVQEPWADGIHQEAGMRTPLCSDPPGFKPRDMSRHHSGGSVYVGDDSDMSVNGSPGLQHRAHANSSSYSSPKPGTFYPTGVRRDVYATSYGGGLPATQAILNSNSGLENQGHSNVPSQSPFYSNPQENVYPKSNFHDIDFACHAQAQSFPSQQHKAQPYPSGFPNPSLYPDPSGLDFNKPRDFSHAITIPRPRKGCRRNSAQSFNDPFTRRDSQENSFSSPPHYLDVPYTSGNNVGSRFTGFVQPELGKPTVSPVFEDSASLRRSNAQSYFPGTHQLHHDKYSGGDSSLRYHRLSPASPPVTPGRSLPLTGGSSSLDQPSGDASEFARSPPTLLYHLPTNPGINSFPRDANSNEIPLHHAQRLRRQHSPEGTQKSARVPRGAQNLPPCRVCGNKASGLHFGVNTCEACNEFFRRSLKRGANYHCSRNLSCKVWGKKRSPCSSCRYRRCLEVGMSRNRIKTGRYSHRTRAEYAQEIERNKRNETYELERERVLSMLETLVENHNRYIRNSTHIPEEDILRTQEKFLASYGQNKKKRRSRRRKAREGMQTEGSANADLNCLTSKTHTEDDNTTNKIFAHEDKATTSATGQDAFHSVKDVLESKANFSPVNLEISKTKDSLPVVETTDKGSVVTKTSDLDTISFVSESPSSSEACRPVESGHRLERRSDQRTDSAVDQGADNSEDIDQVNAEDSDATDSDYFSDCMGLTALDADITERWLRSFITYAKLVPGFKDLPISDQANLVRLSWFEFWFLGAYRGFNSRLKVVMYPIGHTLHASQFTSVFGEEFSSWSFHLADRMRGLRLSAEEMVLMKTVCLLAPDRCELKGKEAVEKMYWAMVSALLHVLQKNRPKDRTVFPKIVSKMVELRTLSAIAMKAHSGALFPDVFAQRPLLGEMVVSNR